MKVLQRFFDFYLDASVHVAFAVLSLVHVTYITLNIPVDYHLCWFLFFSSISCYNFIKYGVEAEKYVLVANSYHRSIQFLSLLCLAFAIYHVYFLSFDAYVGIAVLLVLTGIYALPVLPFSKNLRSWGALKIFVVALVWSTATVVLPILSADFLFSWDIGVETFQRFLFVLVLMVPFEIRDLIYDATELKTIPQRYGITNTKIFGAFMVLLFFFATFLKDEIAMVELLAKGCVFLILGILMFVTNRNQPKYFASFFVESIPIGYWVLMLVLIKRGQGLF